MRRFPGMRMEIRQTTKEKIMGIFSMILSLLSGVALFLFGMSLMGDGPQPLWSLVLSTQV